MVRLHTLEMSWFRGIREGSLSGLTDVNLLIGRNNSGKTSIAEAIYRLGRQFYEGSADSLGRRFDIYWSQVRNEEGEYPQTLWYRGDLSNVVKLSAFFVKDDSGIPNSSHVFLAIKGSPGRVEATPSADFPGSGPSKAECGHFFKNMTVFRPQDAFNRTVELILWPRLIYDRRDKILTKVANDVFGMKSEGFQPLPDSRLMVLFADHSLPVDVQGDGARTVLRALMALTLMRGTLLILEEPECHQHPGSLERYASAVCHLAREQQVQLIISTHSGECVRSFLKASQAAGSEGAVFHLTLEDGKQEAQRLDAQAVETLQATGVDVRFLDLYG